MTEPRIVSHEEWLQARKAYLAKEKEFTRLRDELSAERRALPWERVDKDYVFDAPEGRLTLAGLFGTHGQLLVYHFMFGPDWNEGCPSCSFWSDNFNGIDAHLAHRDTSFALVSRGPIDKLEAYRKRMGWSFKWFSSFGNDFNRDYHVSHTSEELAKGEGYYNYNRQKPYASEAPGISIFRKGPDGTVFHTYSTYARGVDMLNGAYQYLDLTAKGRDEDSSSDHPSGWVRHHDKYEGLKDV